MKADMPTEWKASVSFNRYWRLRMSSPSIQHTAHVPTNQQKSQ